MVRLFLVFVMFDNDKNSNIIMSRCTKNEVSH